MNPHDSDTEHRPDSECPSPGYVRVEDVRHFLERVLGTHRTDWRAERWDTGYEGWSGALFYECEDDDCCLSDPTNLTDGDLALVAALYEQSDEGQS